MIKLIKRNMWKARIKQRGDYWLDMQQRKKFGKGNMRILKKWKNQNKIPGMLS